jgi:hypothetical protein
MDDIEKRTLRDRLINNPVERDKFIANPAKYLSDNGMSVPEQPIQAFMEEPVAGPPVVSAFCVGYTS